MRKTMKKRLSFIMAVVILLYSWVWIVPEKAKAGDIEVYYPYTVHFQITNTCEAGGHILLYYYKFNSDGTLDKSTRYEYPVVNSLIGDGLDDIGFYTVSGYCPGFPCGIRLQIENNMPYNAGARLRGLTIGNNNNVLRKDGELYDRAELRGGQADDIWYDHADHNWPLPNFNGSVGNVDQYGVTWVGNTQILPEGYDFYRDRYNFPNLCETIDFKYYKTFYGWIKGYQIWKAYEENGAHGHCYGMATSTASTLLNAPTVNSYNSNYLIEVSDTATNNITQLNTRDFIKYCHIYQASSYIQQQRDNPAQNGIQNVFNAIYRGTKKNNTTGYCIDFWGGPGGHTVYAVGIEGDDILVNDSNEPNRITKIEIDGNDWSYTGGGFTWSSDSNCTIDYVYETSFVYNAFLEQFQKNSRSLSTTSFIDCDNTLLKMNGNDFSFSNEDALLEIKNTENNTVNESDNKLYWYIGDSVINATNITNKESALDVVGNDLKISAQLPANATAEMTVKDSEDGVATFNVNEGDELTVSFVTVDENNEFVTIETSGTASGSTITATETETGVTVEGFNNLTITYTDVDTIEETKIKNAGGERINIIVDEENNDITTDYVCTHADENSDCICDKCEVSLPHIETDIPAVPVTCTSAGLTEGTKCSVCGASLKEQTEVSAKGHIDDNTDGSCDTCGEVLNTDCSHMCHKDGFIGFIWKIILFFQKLFGTNKACSCGVAHY